jgi:hypothetical protein
MRTTRLVPALAGVVALCASCASTPEERMSAWRESAVSPERFETVLPYLEALSPGDELRIFAGARRVYERDDGRPVVVIPSWITSLSGGAAGGMSMFGQLVGRADDVIHGSHVFGFVHEDRIIPRYQVVTRATIVSREEHAALLALRAPALGVLARPTGLLHFKDLHVAGARPLHFPEPTAAEPPAIPPEAGVAAFYTEASFREVEPTLEGLPEGTDLFSMLLALGATFVSHDHGETHHLRAPGFLQTKRVRTQTVEAPDGIIKLRPFGWVESETEVVELIAVFEDDRLTRVVRHAGLGNWLAYARDESVDASTDKSTDESVEESVEEDSADTEGAHDGSARESVDNEDRARDESGLE